MPGQPNNFYFAIYELVKHFQKCEMDFDRLFFTVNTKAGIKRIFGLGKYH